MAAPAIVSPSPPFASHLLLCSPSKTLLRFSYKLRNPRLSLRSSSLSRPIHQLRGFPRRRPTSWRISAAPTDAFPSEAPVETAQQIVSSTSTDGDVTSTIVSALLFVAFVGLSILTIGVVYLAVTDFLQKREREKFEKEEVANKKKGGKKKKVRARDGPRGFGQKIEEEEEEDGGDD